MSLSWKALERGLLKSHASVWRCRRVRMFLLTGLMTSGPSVCVSWGPFSKTCLPPFRSCGVQRVCVSRAIWCNSRISVPCSDPHGVHCAGRLQIHKTRKLFVHLCRTPLLRSTGTKHGTALPGPPSSKAIAIFSLLPHQCFSRPCVHFLGEIGKTTLCISLRCAKSLR